MSTQVQTFQDFPLTFLEHENVPYISHRSLAEYFKWPKTTRTNRFKKIAETQPEMVAYFQTTHGGRSRKLDPSFVGTEEFTYLNNTRQITRCLTKQGLILELVKEDKHPRAVEFQKFACAVLDSYMTHGEVGPHQASSVAELTAKINAENEAKRLENERLRIEFDGRIKLKRLEIEEQKVQNESLIQEKEQLQTENYQLQNLQAIPLIYRVKGIRQPSKSEFEAAKKLVKQLGNRFIEWKNKKPYFLNQQRFNEAALRIRRARFHVPTYEMTDGWKVANKHCGFK